MTSGDPSLQYLPGELGALAPRRFQRVIVLPLCGSTQDEARTRCDGSPGLIVVAERQSSGRGRLGRAWSDTREHGLAATFVVSAREVAPETAAIVGGLASCLAIASWLSAGPDAAARTLASLLASSRGPLLWAAANALCTQGHAPVGIRWPNDVVEARAHVPPGRKISGVLVERSDDLLFIGVGINVGQTDEHWPPDLARTAVSLAQLATEGGRPPAPVARLPVALALAVALEGMLDLPEGDRRALWHDRNVLRDRRCAFVHNGRTFIGTVVGIDPANHIELRDDHHVLHRLPCNTTSLVHGTIGGDATPRGPFA